MRYDYYKAHFPGQTLGPVTLVPSRNILISDTPQKNWKDVTPRLGAAYDLFGSGKTALKVSLNKYLYGEYDSNLVANPTTTLINTTTRTWTDSNRNFVPDCDLTNPLANGECAVDANVKFRQGGARHDLRPRDTQRVGQPRLQLGVLRGRAARDYHRRVGERDLFPTVVRKLYDD